jgi:hypothetical protein
MLLQLYWYNCSRFHRIFLAVDSGIFNSRLALRTDFLGLQVKVSRTVSTVSSAVATIGLFQMLRSLCVIDTNFTILLHFLLKLWRSEIL